MYDNVATIGELGHKAGIKRIHILAWRDLADVEAGGSELHASAVAARWAKAGLEVMMRTSYAQGAPPETVRDGYTVVRRAGRYLVFPRAVASELLGRHGHRDALVEVWNGVPFFSPIWARGPRATWLHHVHEDMWPMVLPPRLARAGQILERHFAPPFYRRTPIVTLSESSRAHILQRMALKASRVTVINPGVGPEFTPGETLSETPLVVAVGRLMPAKDFPALVDAMHIVRQSIPHARLVIIGEGYDRHRIERHIAHLKATKWCELLGRVSHDALIDWYRRAWAVASTSLAEGWGMTLTEAAACGTPAVATRIPGHTDAVNDQVTGLLVNTADELAGALSQILSNDALRTRLSRAAQRRAETLTWDRTAYETLAVLAKQRRR